MFFEISQNSQENICVTASILSKLQVEACNFIKKVARAQIFFREFREISMSTFLTEDLWATASVSATLLKNESIAND